MAGIGRRGARERAAPVFASLRTLNLALGWEPGGRSARRGSRSADKRAESLVRRKINAVQFVAVRAHILYYNIYSA